MSATDPRVETLALLRRIAVAVEKLARTAPQEYAPAIASDSDLDSKFGDEEVRFDPRDWSKGSMKGRRMSDCPPEFLDLLADAFHSFAEKNAASGAMTNGDKPKAEYDRRSESRARGWARRLRQQATGRTPPKANGTSDWTDADSEWPGPEPF